VLIDIIFVYSAYLAVASNDKNQDYLKIEFLDVSREIQVCCLQVISFPVNHLVLFCEVKYFNDYHTLNRTSLQLIF